MPNKRRPVSKASVKSLIVKGANLDDIFKAQREINIERAGANTESKARHATSLHIKSVASQKFGQTGASTSTSRLTARASPNQPSPRVAEQRAAMRALVKVNAQVAQLNRQLSPSLSSTDSLVGTSRPAQSPATVGGHAKNIFATRISTAGKKSLKAKLSDVRASSHLSPRTSTTDQIRGSSRPSTQLRPEGQDFKAVTGRARTSLRESEAQESRRSPGRNATERLKARINLQKVQLKKTKRDSIRARAGGFGGRAIGGLSGPFRIR